MIRIFALCVMAVSACAVTSVRAETRHPKKVKAEVVGNYQVIVDYSRNIEEMVAKRDYKWVATDISKEQFAIMGTGTPSFNVVLFHFEDTVSLRDIFLEMKKRGLEPASLEHLLAFGLKYPDEQEKYQIVALGSMGVVITEEEETAKEKRPNGEIREHVKKKFLFTRVAAYLTSNEGLDSVECIFPDGRANDWSPDYYFLAIRVNPSPKTN